MLQFAILSLGNTQWINQKILPFYPETRITSTMNQQRYLQNFYYEQNLQIRKEIRQLDLQYQQNINTNHQIYNTKKDINFLVIGPQKSGKSSLLKTMSYALNTIQPSQLSTQQIPQAYIKRCDIKKSKRHKIEGLTKVKQSEQRQSITGFQVQQKISSKVGRQQKLSSEQKLNKYIKKYQNILKLLNQKLVGCCRMKNVKASNCYRLDDLFVRSEAGASCGIGDVKVVLVVIDICQKVQTEETSCLKFFIADIKERGIKTLVLLTNLDRLVYMGEYERLSLIEEKIVLLKKELDIQNRDHFICIYNYQFQGGLINQKGNYPRQKKLNKIQSNQTRYNANCQKYQIQEFKESPSSIKKGLYQFKSSTNSIPPGQASSQLWVKVEKSNNYNKNLYSFQVPDFSNPQKIDGLNTVNNNPIKTLFSALSSPKIHSPIKKMAISSSFNELTSKNKSMSSQPTQKTIPRNKSAQIGLALANNQQINYYSLKLLMRVIRENDKIDRQQDGSKKFISWFCG